MRLAVRPHCSDHNRNENSRGIQNCASVPATSRFSRLPLSAGRRLVRTVVGLGTGRLLQPTLRWQPSAPLVRPPTPPPRWSLLLFFRELLFLLSLFAFVFRFAVREQQCAARGRGSWPRTDALAVQVAVGAAQLAPRQKLAEGQRTVGRKRLWRRKGQSRGTK